MVQVLFVGPLDEVFGPAPGANIAAAAPIRLQVAADPAALAGEAFISVTVSDSSGAVLRSAEAAFAPAVTFSASQLNLATLPTGQHRIAVQVLDAARQPVAGGSRLGGFTVFAAAPGVIQAETALVTDTVGTTGAALTRAVSAAAPDAGGIVRPGAVGGAYIDFGANPGDAITLTAQAPAPGVYTLSFRYANGAGADRPLDLSVNGAAAGTLGFAPTAAAAVWDVWAEASVRVRLAEGANAIRLAIPPGRTGGPNIDQLSVTPVAVTLNDAPSAPVLTGDPVPENAPGAAAGALSAFDVDGDPVAFSTADPRFEVTPEGALRLKPGVALDFEATLTGTVAVAVTARDGRGGETAGTVTVRVADLPEAPSVEPGPRATLRFAFQDGAVPRVAGHLPAAFDGFGPKPGGLSYGFVTEASVLDADPARATPVDPALYPASAVTVRSGLGTTRNIDEGRDFDALDPRQTGIAAFDGPGYPAGAGRRTAFELAVANGWYEVTVSVGDSGGPNDSVNALRVEGAEAVRFTPANLSKSVLATVVAEVRDGFLTLSAPDGENTEIQTLEVRALPDLTPGDGRAAPLDYARFVNPVAISGAGSGVTSVSLDPAAGPARGIDPTADLVLGVNVAPDRGGALLASLGDGSIRLYETLTGAAVAFTANTTAGFDSVTISPALGLKPFTSYTLVADGFQDRGANGVTGGPTREFLKFSTSFVTGDVPPAVNSQVAFTHSQVAGGFVLTSLEMAPDGLHLYAASLGGVIKRWSVDAATGALSDEQTLSLGHFQQANGPRGIIGLAFDPSDPSVLWVTDNDPVPLNGRQDSVPDFSGRVSRITLGAGPEFTGVAETYVQGLPRSNGDHVTNSLEFRANPAAGAGGPSHLLYLAQGSNNAIGGADSAWGFRPERLLSAAVLEIDPTRAAPPGGFDVRTEPLPVDGRFRRFGYETVVNGQLAPTDDGDLKNGGIAIGSGPYQGSFLHFDARGVASVRSGALADSPEIARFYDPFAPDAVVKLFGEGVRNAYDLVWHSNGRLYVPTNGSGAGGVVPNDPRTPANEGFTNVVKQDDYLFTVSRGGYYGHPNPLLDHYVLNGGNPTAGRDPAEVTTYPAGLAPDPAFLTADAYSLGANRSPNGAIEYRSGVFGAGLRGAVLFTEYSTGNEVRAVLLDAQGRVSQDFALRDPQGRPIAYPDPLDIIEGGDGRLYLLTLERTTGQSRIVRLTPTPLAGGADLSADLDGDLALAVVDAGRPRARVLDLDGRDPDIVETSVSLDRGATWRAAVLDGDGRFVVDAGGLTGPVTALLRVRDAAGNVATASASFDAATGASLFDATALQLAGPGVVRRIDLPATHEPPGPDDANGDGLHDGFDGLGYLDPEGAAGVKAILRFDAPAAGVYAVTVRYANGGSDPAPLAVEAGGVKAAIPDTRTGAQSSWAESTVTLALARGVNEIALEQTGAAAPDIDSLRVAPSGIGRIAAPNAALTVGGRAYDGYEAEFAILDGAAAVLRTDDERGASGAGFAAFTPGAPGSVSWIVETAAAGVHPLQIVYALGAGQPSRTMTLSIDGVAAETLTFAPNSNAAQTQWGLRSAAATLDAGVHVITLSSATGLAPAIDQLRVAAAPNAPLRPDIRIQSLDAAYFDDRLHFSVLENPADPSGAPARESKTSGVVRVTNAGVDPLTISEATLTGPFTLASPAALQNRTLAAGASLDVTVLFDRARYAPPAGTRDQIDRVSTVFEGALRLRSDDPDTPVAEVDLAGFWQARVGDGLDPNLNEIFQVMGFGNRIAGLSLERGGQFSALSGRDVYRAVDASEVLSPYWSLAPGAAEARITAVASYNPLRESGVIGLHAPGDIGSTVAANRLNFWTRAATDTQQILPNAANNASAATRAFTAATIPDAWPGGDTFGFRVEGRSSDPRLNPAGNILVDAAGVEYVRLNATQARDPLGRTVEIASLTLRQQGQFVKMFQALDADGAPIPDVYIGAQDYLGGNYGYNDNVFVVEGVRPAGFGSSLALSDLDAAVGGDRLAFTSLTAPVEGQAFRNEATITLVNDGYLAQPVTSAALSGPGAAAFQIVSAPAAVPAGGTAALTVRFVGTDAAADGAATPYEAVLTIGARGQEAATRTIALAGLAQFRSGDEPNVTAVARALGYLTDFGQAELTDGGRVEAVGEETLAPYLERLDPSRPVEITQIGAFMGQFDVARLGTHALSGARVTPLVANDDQQGQTVLPEGLLPGPGDAGAPARGAFSPTAPFGLRLTIDGKPTLASWSDPAANDRDPVTGALVPDGFGHMLRLFQARTAAGPVEGAYIMVADTPGSGNYDYNDQMYLLRNVRPHVLTAIDDSDGDGVNDALQLDRNANGTPDFFDMI